MVKFVRCKVCGFVIKESKLKDVCPACGVKKTAFEPYESKVSLKRREILSLHIHSILVHFPQGFVPVIFLLTIFTMTFKEPIQTYFYYTLRVLGTFLPFVILAAGLSGLFDGKVRFKSYKPPLLRRKIFLASITLFISVFISVLVYIVEMQSLQMLWLVVLSLLLVINVLLLGLTGGNLICSVKTGK
ncbi:MAG: rubredoxin-like domain-containing protein [Candidatus Heimdallarchaeaceae archaeon]